MTDFVSLEARFGAGNYAPLPVTIGRGQGVYVWDESGRRYIDMMGAYSAVSFGHTTIRSSTLVMPGADQATRSASSRSIQERTVPFNITSLPLASTVIRLASTSAFRLNASMILRLSSEGCTLGFTVTTLVTPLTPFTFRTQFSAVVF